MLPVFDLSGVVFNDGLATAVAAISASRGLDAAKLKTVLDGSFAREYRLGLEEPASFWQSAGKELGVQDVSALRQEYFDCFEPWPESIAFVRRLRSRGTKVAFLSNSPADRAAYLEEKFGVAAQFNFGIYSFEAHLLKPDKRVYELFSQRFGVPAAETAYIDDEEKNLAPASELGIHAILFNGLAALELELNKLGVAVQ